MNKNNEITSRIKKVRLDANENLSEFARSLGIPRSTLVGYEKDSTVPAYILATIASKYNVSEKWLLLGTPPQKVENTANLTKNKLKIQPFFVSNETTEPIIDYASAIEELLKPLIIKINGKDTAPPQKALDLIEELSQVLAEPTDKNAPKLDKKTEDRLEEMTIEMANIKKNMQILMKKMADNEEKT